MSLYIIPYYVLKLLANLSKKKLKNLSERYIEYVLFCDWYLVCTLSTKSLTCQGQCGGCRGCENNGFSNMGRRGQKEEE